LRRGRNTCAGEDDHRGCNEDQEAYRVGSINLFHAVSMDQWEELSSFSLGFILAGSEMDKLVHLLARPYS